MPSTPTAPHRASSHLWHLRDAHARSGPRMVVALRTGRPPPARRRPRRLVGSRARPLRRLARGAGLPGRVRGAAAAPGRLPVSDAGARLLARSPLRRSGPDRRRSLGPESIRPSLRPAPEVSRSRDRAAQTLARILTRSCIGEERPTRGRLVRTSVESGGSHEPATLNAPRARRPAQSRLASRGTDRRALRAAQRGRCCSPSRAADKLRTRSRGVVDLQAPARPPSGLPHHGLGTFRRRREGCPPPVPALLRTRGTTSEGAQRGVRATAVHVERVEPSRPVADHDLPVGEDR